MMELFVLFQHIHYFNENAFFYVSSSNINKINVKKLVPYIFQYGIETDNISAGLDPVLSHTEKSYIVLFYRQFSTNIKIKIIRLIPVVLAWAFAPSGLTIMV